MWLIASQFSSPGDPGEGCAVLRPDPRKVGPALAVQYCCLPLIACCYIFLTYDTAPSSASFCRRSVEDSSSSSQPVSSSPPCLFKPRTLMKPFLTVPGNLLCSSVCLFPADVFSPLRCRQVSFGLFANWVTGTRKPCDEPRWRNSPSFDVPSSLLLGWYFLWTFMCYLGLLSK